MILLEDIGNSSPSNIHQVIFIYIIDAPPLQYHLTTGKVVQTTDNVEQGRFATAGRSHNGDKVTLIHLK